MVRRSFLAASLLCLGMPSFAQAQGLIQPQQWPWPKLEWPGQTSQRLLVVPEKDMLAAAYCDFGNAALRSRGQRSIDDLQFNIQTIFKKSVTLTNNGSFGVTGVAIIPGVTFGVSLSPSETVQFSGIATEFKPPMTAKQLAANCQTAGYRHRRRPVSASSWLSDFTAVLSKFRNGEDLGASYDASFAVTTSATTGVNFQFLLTVSNQTQYSYAATQEIKIQVGKGGGF